jgi:hypothetical protein
MTADRLREQVRARYAMALSRGEHLDGPAAVGFADATVTFADEAAPGMHTAVVRATKPA